MEKKLEEQMHCLQKELCQQMSELERCVMSLAVRISQEQKTFIDQLTQENHILKEEIKKIQVNVDELKNSQNNQPDIIQKPDLRQEFVTTIHNELRNYKENEKEQQQQIIQSIEILKQSTLLSQKTFESELDQIKYRLELVELIGQADQKQVQINKIKFEEFRKEIKEQQINDMNQAFKIKEGQQIVDEWELNKQCDQEGSINFINKKKFEELKREINEQQNEVNEKINQDESELSESDQQGLINLINKNKFEELKKEINEQKLNETLQQQREKQIIDNQNTIQNEIILQNEFDQANQIKEKVDDSGQIENKTSSQTESTTKSQFKCESSNQQPDQGE